VQRPVLLAWDLRMEQSNRCLQTAASPRQKSGAVSVALTAPERSCRCRRYRRPASKGHKAVLGLRRGAQEPDTDLQSC